MSTHARILAAWQAITAAVKADTISVAFKSATIGLIAELGQFVEVLFKTDDVGLTDAQKQAFYKVSTDAYVALDKYIATVTKGRIDGAALAEHEFAAVSKVLGDVSDLLDAYKATIHKPFYEQVTGLEDYVYVFAKKAPENFVTPTDRIDTKGTTKPRFDAYVVGDEDTVQFAKDRQDVSTFADYRYGYIQKVLTDTLNVTDDIDGAASIDDDQEVQFFKVMGELTATLDEFYRFMAFVRAFSDDVGFSDTSYNRLDKPFGDMVAGVEDHAYVLSRKTPDSPTEFVDAAAYNANKPITDSSTVSDDDTVQFTKDRQDPAIFLDVQALEVSKPQSDNSSVSDNTSTEFTKALSDEINVVDILDQATIVVKRVFIEETATLDQFAAIFTKQLDIDEYSVSDIATIAQTKKLSELAFMSEMLYRNTNKKLVDTTGVSESKAISASKPTNDGFSLTDSGSLRSQSYCDFTYIAENYVGESRTF